MKKPSTKQPDPHVDPLRAEIWAIEHGGIHIPMNGALRASGGILIDGREVAQTLRCCHCQRTWIPVKGSGKIRGWCPRCQGPVCSVQCAICVPFERALDLMERVARET